ncbi:cadmium-translocating P-type ATPase [Synechococcus sp. WH 8101]|nr:cadmium-translocating P-type ATPase [Synechococcus sp. WH 8101]QVV68941.1 cation-translocating P-type ATPase [Synechococcus sp. LA31]
MDCAAEENEIRQALAGVTGIADLRFQLASRTLAIRAKPAALSTAETILRRLGYPPQVLESGSPAAPVTGSVPWTRLIAALMLAAAAEGIHALLPQSWLHEALEIALALGAIPLAGLPVYTKGLAALRLGRLNINALMTVAVTGAFLIGHWPEAAMVMALYAIAEALEAQAADRARAAISRLMELAPEQARIKQDSGEWALVGVAAVVINQLVRVEPGERIPLDGVVATGNSAVNQAPVTGESLPVEKGAGDQVFAGTVNTHGSLVITVTAPASKSTLARIIHAVEEAQASRAPIQRFVDRFAARYTPAVFVLALALALLSPPLLGLTPIDAVYRALVLLVIACPCALVIATPVTLVSGLTAAARRGIVIKGGLYLEQARQLRTLAFDKTGTLTTGRPTLEAFQVIDGRVPITLQQQWAASLASRSDHPISRAIAAALNDERLAVEALKALGGRGVSGEIDGQTLRLANHRWVHELGLCTPDLEQAMSAHEQRGRSVSLLTDAHGVLALIAVADQPRATAAAAITGLRQLGLTPVMLSGDNARTAGVIADRLGIEQVRSELLPEQKLAAIAQLQAQAPTGMVGDGINDAPALAGAAIGVAMGAAGSDTAMEAADVVVMDDDPQRLVELIRLSRCTWAVLWQNIALALGIKGAFLVLTLLGTATMWQAVFADMGTSLLVIANGLRLRRQQWA